jgi:hypothetical protein
MSPSFTPVKRALLGAALAALAGAAFAAANPEPMDLDADILAEIARQKARATTQARQAANAGKPGKAGEKPSAECGAVSIGNVIGNGRIGFSPIDVNVVIVGDIINANNKCR